MHRAITKRPCIAFRISYKEGYLESEKVPEQKEIGPLKKRYCFCSFALF